MAEDGKIKIDEFDGHDFGFWRMQIEDYLYQKKLYEPLEEAKPTGINAEDWTLLDRQALVVALSNMYEKPSASNKVFLIRQLMNTKMKEGVFVADHVNEFNSILSRLMSVDIKFNDEVQALFLLPEIWSGTITTVSGSTRTTKLKFDNIHDLILGEDIRRKTYEDYSKSLLSAEDKGRGRKQDKGQKQNRGRSKSKKSASKDKEVKMAVRDYDDTLVRLADDKTLDIVRVGDVVLKTSFGTDYEGCFDRGWGQGNDFHLRKLKMHLFDGNDVFGWVYQAESFFDVQKVNASRERLRVAVQYVALFEKMAAQLVGIQEEILEGTFIKGLKPELRTTIRTQQPKGVTQVVQLTLLIDETKKALQVLFVDDEEEEEKEEARGNKRGSLFMVEVPSDKINAAIGRGKAALWNQRHGHMGKKGMKILASKGRILDLQKAVAGFCEPCVLGKQKKAAVENETTLWVKCLC
uniref:Retrovirus-related Pol polyprotein from transposon TNT 1-94 n=1 Tax=Tanacetum cinerariifolium TaxID=118510 RepID=A0A6L2JD55_TANCI|nr:retrovirus-related Pol polyprotein from transposon TNT 1-94 [Tanacetum cinerariifolium]